MSLTFVVNGRELSLSEFTQAVMQAREAESYERGKAEGRAEVLREVAKLEPLRGGGSSDEPWYCIWCHAVWPGYDTSDKHPDNNCLWPQAQAVTRDRQGEK